MKVSVVILNWNGEALLRSYLPNVVRHTLETESPWQVELVVADNGSNDNSLGFLRSEYPQVRIVELRQNYGFADGYNMALQQVDATYTVLLNSDVEVTQGWLSELIRFMDDHTDVAACQPKIRSLREPAFFEHAGAAGGFLDALGYPFCRGRLLNVLEEDKGQYDAPMDVLWATGACLCVRTAVYHEAGGLDGCFFAHMEEIDLCWRLRSRGQRICCVPASVVFHLGGATLERQNPHKTYLNFRNNLLMLYKNVPKGALLKVLLLRLCFDNASAVIFLLSGKPGDALAVWKARLSFWKMLPDYRSIRRYNLLLQNVLHIPEIYSGSILLQFYLKGIRTFDRVKLNARTV